MNIASPLDEPKRLAALRRYRVLDTPAEASFDDLTVLASRVCQVPVALVSLVDEDRLWFKSCVGASIQEHPRESGFCAHVILQREEVLEVCDTLADDRFSQMPMVASEPYFRFYAGAPLVTPEGLTIGSLCVLDYQPRQLTPEQKDSLVALSRQVVSQLEFRRQAEELMREGAEREAAQAKLRAQNEQLICSEAETARLLALTEKARSALVIALEAEQQAGQDLRESEERFRQLADNIREAFWISDLTRTEMIYISPAFEVIWGRSCASLHDSPQIWLDAIHPEDRQRLQEEAAVYHRHGAYDAEYRIMRPDGTLRWIRDRAFPVRNAAGEVYRMAGVAQDITERKLGEDRLREQASLLDRAQDAIIVRDLDHRVTYWNKSAERLYGWSEEEVLGKAVKDLLYKDTTTFEKACEDVFSAGEWVGELHQVSKTGTALIVEGRWTLLRDAAGQPKGILGINTDITRQKKLEHQFLRAQRMESIGALAGGIAHDLNNVLTPITMAIDFLRLKVTDAKCLEVLDTIASSAHRGADMVGQVLSFARGVEGRRIEVQPRHLIMDIERICRETFPKDIQLHITVERDLWTLQGDPTQLHQVLLNLCVNARDAMLRGGTLTVHARNVMLDAQFASMNIEANPGSHILFEVHDTGTGISRESIDKIFDPFFTTKELGKGTGLGLSTSLSIVKSHGGFMQVESEPGRGARFSVYIPATSLSSGVTSQEPGLHLPRGNGETILVVDDEAFVRQITRQTLEGFGYKVMLASEGAEAVTIYAQHRQEIAAVLTDMMMPVMDGASTIMVLLRMNPEVKVIAASGITTERNVMKANHAGVKRFIPKPYTAETLLTALKDVIECRS